MATSLFTIRRIVLSDRIHVVHELDRRLAAPAFHIEATPLNTIIHGTTRALTLEQINAVVVELRMAAQESLRLSEGDTLDEYDEPAAPPAGATPDP